MTTKISCPKVTTSLCLFARPILLQSFVHAMLNYGLVLHPYVLFKYSNDTPCSKSLYNGHSFETDRTLVVPDCVKLKICMVQNRLFHCDELQFWTTTPIAPDYYSADWDLGKL